MKASTHFYKLPLTFRILPIVTVQIEKPEMIDIYAKWHWREIVIGASWMRWKIYLLIQF